MEFIDKNTIKLERELSELDKFVLGFLKVIEKYVDYVVVSGYVSILFGRARGTEDVDIFFKEVDKEKFSKLFNNLKKEYWCLNSDDENEVYEYLEDRLAVRFAKKNETIPNFEVKFALRQIDKEAFIDPLVVITKSGKLKISSLERQIAFKKYYLKSDKDLEDAAHMEKLFKEHIDYDKIKECKKRLENEKT